MFLISLSRGGLGVESYVSMPGGTLLLTYADKRGEQGQKSENFADIICERSPNRTTDRVMGGQRFGGSKKMSDFKSSLWSENGKKYIRLQKAK